MPGEDRHSQRARSPALAGGARGAGEAVAGAPDDESPGAGIRLAAGLRAGAATGATRTRSDGAASVRATAGVDGGARPAGGPRAAVSRVVEGAEVAMTAARDEV